MNRDTYWLLDAAVEIYVSLQSIALEYNVTIVRNRPWHGMDEDQLVQTLHTAFAEGDLVAMVIGDGEPGDTFAPTSDEVRAALGRMGGLYYGLTPQGGALGAGLRAALGPVSSTTNPTSREARSAQPRANSSNAISLPTRTTAQGSSRDQNTGRS